jgi:16S rRNA G966 N2-methylase RsmD
VFYYYGSKRRLAGLYPPPSYDTIIEPFAGAAAYSMRHVRSRAVRRVVLIEKDPRVVHTWLRLLQMSADDLRAFPDPVEGETTTDFLVMTSAASNAIASCKSMTVTARQASYFRGMLRQMGPLLEAVKAKVEVVLGDYHEARWCVPQGTEATWFVDPPYMIGERSPNGNIRPQGAGYAKGCGAASLDYAELGAWCRSLPGQRIVCEQDGADWLPFRHLRGSRDSMGRMAAEVVWADPEHQMSLLG